MICLAPADFVAACTVGASVFLAVWLAVGILILWRGK